ncbi:MAG: ABC transporter permease subunit [Bacteroidota bacterium]
MNHIFTVARKEFLDTLRDRRTLMMMLLVPLVLFPAIFYVSITIQASQEKKAREKKLKIALIDNGFAHDFRSMLSGRDDLIIIDGIAASETDSLIRSDSLDLAIVFADDFGQMQDSLETGTISLIHQTDDNDRIEKRGVELIKNYEAQLTEERLASLQITASNIDPIDIDNRNVASDREVIGKIVGGFLPYIFILFTFLGCMYPAIDLFAGEKERGTIETILSVPIPRTQILIGKLIVVATTGLFSALTALLSLSLSMQFMPIPDVLVQAVGGVLQVGNILLILGMMIPLSIFFAGLMTALSTFAKSYKEAQSTIAPLNILVIVPAAIGLMPGIELNYGTALIPILNVALATKEIVAGTAPIGPLLIVMVSLVLLAGVAVVASARWFASEQNVLRS